jgi:hypothetical protein
MGSVVYKEMPSLEEKIRELEEEIRRTPYNKATQHHIGRLKAKLARLREEAERRGEAKGAGRGYAVRKSGDATVALVGFPSVGKSTLLNVLTNAESEVGSYDFTTLDVVPGVLEYRGAKIQILDVPGLIRGASRGRGRGREVLSVIRSADLILLLIDVFNIEQYRILVKELHDAGIRLDATPPKVKITKKAQGGIKVNSTVPLKSITEETIKAILNEYRVHNADVVIHEDLDEERFIDAIAGNRVYIPSLVALNKIDLVGEEYLREVASRLGREFVAISAGRGIGIEELKEKIYSRLGFIRVYMKPQRGEADLEEPLIVRRGTTVAEVCQKLHRDFVERFRYAQVWGRSVRFPGQRVGLEHVLEDEDILTIVVRK